MNEADRAILRRNVASVRLCKDWQAEALAILRAGTDVVRLAPGEILVAHGQPFQGLYGVLAGALEIRLGQPSRRSQVRMVARSGEAFGFIGVFGGFPSPHSYVAKEPSIVLRFSKAGLLATLARFPQLWLDVAKEMAHHQMMTLTAAEADNLVGLRVRMIRALLALAASRGEKARDHAELSITQDGLSAMLLVSRQSVSTELRWLKSKGVLTTSYRRIAIRSTAKLSGLLAELQRAAH